MLKIILLAALLFSSLFSQEKKEFTFLGLSISKHTIEMNPDTKQVDSIGLRCGKQTLDWRTVFTYEDAEEYRSFSVEVDRILLDELFGTPKLRPYLGISAGILKLDYDSLADTSGYYYGANTGFILYTTDTVDIDLAYHYYSVQKIESIDKIEGISLSIHYFY